MRAAPFSILAVLAVVATAGVAHAYPQYQLSREQTCASCHVSPVGGGLLDLGFGRRAERMGRDLPRARYHGWTGAANKVDPVER